MKTIAYIMSTYHIGTYNLDIRDVLKSYIIARYYGWEPKEEDLEEIISHNPISILTWMMLSTKS